MKRLLARGAPSIFQVAPCFRAAEHGDLHREQFHLVEWYRLDHDADTMRRDVEAVVAAVFEAVSAALEEPAVAAPSTWIEVSAVPLMERTLGVSLRGDEDVAALADALQPVRGALGDPLAAVPHEHLVSSPRAHTLAAWTAFFSTWCDARLDAWLLEQGAVGVHLVEFPTALAALSEVAPSADGRQVAHRFESHVSGRELANGYRELRDAAEQRRRFDDVNVLRDAMGLRPLPLDEAFLSELREPGLPPCAGVALGLERLVLLASARRRLGDVTIELGAPGG